MEAIGRPQKGVKARGTISNAFCFIQSCIAKHILNTHSIVSEQFISTNVINIPQVIFIEQINDQPPTEIFVEEIHLFLKTEWEMFPRDQKRKCNR